MVIQSFAPVLGGAQRQIQALAPLLAAHGAEVRVVTRRWEASSALRERQPGLRLWRVPGSGHHAVSALAWPVGAVAATVALRPDVIHAHDLLSPTSIALAAGRTIGAPVVVKVLSTGAGGDVDRLLAKPFGERRLHAVLREAAAFVCLTADVEGELLAHGVAPERLRRIPNGVDLARFRPATTDERAAERQRLGLPQDGPVTLYCGRFRDVKRLDVLLDAFARASGHLVLAGDGPEAPKLLAAGRTGPVQGRVSVLDTVADPAPLYRAADVYASASLTEGMSGSVLEAMASGLAVAASPASGMEELLGAGAGAVAADASAPALGRVLEDLTAAPTKRASAGERGRRRVQESYSLEATAGALSDLYATVRRA